jgi:DNA gyrase subunit A
LKKAAEDAAAHERQRKEEAAKRKCEEEAAKVAAVRNETWIAMDNVMTLFDNVTRPGCPAPEQVKAASWVVFVIPVQSYDDGKYLVMLTRRGVIKKTELSAFSNIRRNGLIAVALDDDDALGWVRLTDGSQSILIGTREGMAIHFPEEDLRPLGRTARGVKAIGLRTEDIVIGMDIGDPTADVLVVTTDGFGKRTPVEEYRLQSRGGLGLINVKLNVNRQGKVAAILVVSENDEVIIVTSSGVVIRQSVRDVRQTGRSAQGTRLQKLGEDERVAGVAPVVVTDEDEVCLEVDASV